VRHDQAVTEAYLGGHRPEALAKAGT
jgi:hypothetical protein